MVWHSLALKASAATMRSLLKMRMMDTPWHSVALEDTEKVLEAGVGIEPTHRGFADLRLPTWQTRRTNYLEKLACIVRDFA